MGKNARLDREPDYNNKRRNGQGLEHLEECPTCHYRIPTSRMAEEGKSVPCSPYHVRCVRCNWPVAADHISPVGTCATCMSAYDRKRYYRRTEGENGGKMTAERDDREFGRVVPSIDATRERQLEQKRWRQKNLFGREERQEEGNGKEETHITGIQQEKEQTLCHNGSSHLQLEELDIGGGNHSNPLPLLDQR